MRRSEKQITDPNDIEFILRRGKLCFLSMVDNGKPYVIPVHYGYEEGVLYIHSAPEGRKIDILRENSEVCFSIVADFKLTKGKYACSWSTDYASAVGTGKATILVGREEKEKGLGILMGQYTDERHDFADANLDGVVIIRVDIEEMTGKSTEGGGRRAERNL